MRVKVNLGILLTLSLATAIAPFAARANDTEALMTVLKNKENKLVDGALQNRLEQFRQKAEPTFAFFADLAATALNETREIRHPRETTVDGGPFWQIIAAWISSPAFRPEDARAVSQIAKIYADPRSVQTDLHRPHEEHLRLRNRNLFVGRFYSPGFSNLGGVKTEALIRALPLLLKVALTPRRTEFLDFKAVIHDFDASTHFQKVYFLIALNATLENLAILHADQVDEAFQILVKFVSDARNAAKFDQMVPWSDKVTADLLDARTRHLQRCLEAVSTLNLF